VNSLSTVNIVLASLFVSAVFFGGAAWNLAFNLQDFAPFLAIASGSVGAIGGLLANTASHPKPDTTITTTEKVEGPKVNV